jgi:DNA-binding IclR family transcriptional regulator
VIAQVESPEPMRLSFAAGTIRPLHAGATATVLLAFERPAAIARVLAGPLERFTPNTITDPARLEQRLGDIRAAGYAVSTGEADLDATAVAAPVFQAGRVLCALSVTGPATRFGPAQIEAYAAVLLAETNELSQLLTVEAD